MGILGIIRYVQGHNFIVGSLYVPFRADDLIFSLKRFDRQ